MKQELEQIIAETCQQLFGVQPQVELTRPEERFGDYATNVALQLAKSAGKPPRDVAAELAAALRERLGGRMQTVEIAGPGFINLKLTDETLLAAARGASTTKPQTYAGQTVVAEYSDPNPFKVLHVGHLYTSLVGDAIANLLAAAGAKVHRVNFGGDVGLHVAKSMWAIVKFLGGEHPEKLTEVDENARAEWLSARYVEGASVYEEDEQAKTEIVEINKHIYALHSQGDHDSPFARIYWTCRQWSYDYFDRFYETVGMAPFEKYYPESATTPLGIATVKEGLAQGVFVQSDGAVVYPGEQDGLHTRVFLNSAGLPTYEAKDLGLAVAKWQDYHFDKSIIITGNDIVEYMKVVQAALKHLHPEITERSIHLTHGMIKLAGGVKMSSRKGNGLRALDVLDAAREANKALMGQDQANEDAVLAAVKYAFLKQRIGGDIVYDPAESVSLQGNSGPYLQYAQARARSILRKAAANEQASEDPKADKSEPATDELAGGSRQKLDIAAVQDSEIDEYSAKVHESILDSSERSLARKIGEYPEVVAQAVVELMPHCICTYLYELAQTFNFFYEHNRVVGDPRAELRLGLVEAYANVLRGGLKLLGISAPDQL